METTKRCPHCGATLPEGSIYCYKCGTKIETPADIPDYSQLVDNTSNNPQDQNIPIDDLLGQTHVINSLMSELDSIVNGDDFDTPVTPSVKPANEDTATHDVPINTSMNRTEEADSSKDEDSNTVATVIKDDQGIVMPIKIPIGYVPNEEIKDNEEI